MSVWCQPSTFPWAHGMSWQDLPKVSAMFGKIPNWPSHVGKVYIYIHNLWTWHLHGFTSVSGTSNPNLQSFLDKIQGAVVPKPRMCVSGVTRTLPRFHLLLERRNNPQSMAKQHGGFHSHGGTPKWMVYREIRIKIDDLGVPPIEDPPTSHHLSRASNIQVKIA